MPLSAVQRRNVSASVQKLLVEEIYGEFLDLYAAAVSLTERHPEQVNNELRNALTHLSRAVASDDFSAANREIDKAKTHVERAKRDAAKVAVIELRDLIADACADIKLLNGTIDPAFVVRRDQLSKERKSILKREAQGVHVLNDFVEFYLKADALHDDLIQTLNGQGRRLPRWRYRLIAARRHILGWIVAIGVGVLGSAVYSALAPDGQAFGNSVRKLLGLPLVKLSQEATAPVEKTISAASAPYTAGSLGGQPPKK